MKKALIIFLTTLFLLIGYVSIGMGILIPGYTLVRWAWSIGGLFMVIPAMIWWYNELTDIFNRKD